MIEATGPLAGPLEALRRLIIACPAWQTITGLSVEDSGDHVHLIAPTAPEAESFSREEAQELRPMAVVWMGAGMSFQRRAVATFNGEGAAYVNIEIDADPDLDERDNEIDFLNKVGSLVDGMLQMDEGAGYLVPLSVDVPEPPQRTPPADRQTQGDYLSIAIVVRWRGGAL